MENEFYQTPETVAEGEYVAPVAEMPEQPPVKKGLPKKAIIGVAVVALVVILILTFSGGPNKYTTPLDLEMAVENAKTYKAQEKAELNMTNGLAESEMKTLLKIMKKSEEYDADDLKEEVEEMVEDYEDEYGKNYKFYYEIEDKDKLDKDDCKDAQDALRDRFDQMYDELKDVESEDLEELADMLGIKKSDAKKMANTMKDYYKKMKKAKVSAGYELEVTYLVDGKELDEPEELYERTVTVYKVNGRWTTLSDLYLNMF